MDLVVLTAFHARFLLNEAFATAMDRLREELGVRTYVVITPGEPENREICEEHGFTFCQHKNNPVSDKLNAGMALLKGQEWSHVMILGSDDIPSTQFVRNQMFGETEDFIAIQDMWFWGMNPKRAGYNTFWYWYAGSSRLGAGRVISRRAVEACDYKIWPSGYNAGMDSQSYKRIKHAIGQDLKAMSYRNKDTGGFLVDIKYELHISSLSPVIRRAQAENPNIIRKHLPEKECDYLFWLDEKIKKENFIK